MQNGILLVHFRRVLVQFLTIMTGSNTLLTIFLDVKECLHTSVIHEVVWSMAGHRNQTIFVSSRDLSLGPFQPWFEEVIKMWALEVDTTHWEDVKKLISRVTTIIYVLNVLLLYHESWPSYTSCNFFATQEKRNYLLLKEINSSTLCQLDWRFLGAPMDQVVGVITCVLDTLI